MPKRKYTNLLLYRRRIVIGYLFVFLALLSLLTVALIIPGGITASEQASAVRAMSIGLLDVNGPYYLLQKIFIHVLGLSVLSIKAPSILLGFVLGTGLFLLLRRWLTLSIAVFSAMIIFAGTTFLGLAGTGSPLILYVLYPTLLIYFGTRVVAHERGLVVSALLLLGTIAVALLTPSMVYLVVLAGLLALLNPHVRYGFRRLPPYGLILLGLGLAAAFVPAVLLVVKIPLALSAILALPPGLSLRGLGDNVMTLFALFLRFLRPSVVSGLIAPLVGLATAGLALIGAYRVARDIYTARAQFIIGWSVIAGVLALLSTDYSILLYLPIVLLASIGLSQLAAVWYRTFPHNPYARVLALVPIGVLIAGIVVGSTLRYINTTLYATGTAALYSRDLQILRTASETVVPEGPVTLVVPEQDVAFYQGLTIPGKVGDPSVITTVLPLSQAVRLQEPIISTQALPDRGAPSRILTDARASGADRFYIYK